MQALIHVSNNSSLSMYIIVASEFMDRDVLEHRRRFPSILILVLHVAGVEKRSQPFFSLFDKSAHSENQ